MTSVGKLYRSKAVVEIRKPTYEWTRTYSSGPDSVTEGSMAETAPRGTIPRDLAPRDTALVHIIDDDDAVRDSLALLLDAAGIAARTYDSATKFLAVARGLADGCVLTDVRMPDLDGLALQRRLTELGVTLPVIVMTGHGDVPIAVAALKAGAADFLEKPFDDERLVAAVRAALTVSREVQRNAAAAA